jgi:hypothetical protein
VILAVKRIIAIATTVAVSAIVIAGEINNRKDTLIVCAEEMTRFRLR